MQKGVGRNLTYPWRAGEATIIIDKQAVADFRALPYKAPPELQCPVTILHSKNDRVIPYEAAEKLATDIVSTGKVSLIPVEGIEHDPNVREDYSITWRHIKCLLQNRPAFP